MAEHVVKLPKPLPPALLQKPRRLLQAMQQASVTGYQTAAGNDGSDGLGVAQSMFGAIGFPWGKLFPTLPAEHKEAAIEAKREVEKWACSQLAPFFGISASWLSTTGHAFLCNRQQTTSHPGQPLHLDILSQGKRPHVATYKQIHKEVHSNHIDVSGQVWLLSP